MIATEGVPAPTKVQGLAYVDRSSGRIEYAYREAEVGNPLAGEPWAIDAISPVLGGPTEEVDWPSLAMDSVTATPYVVYQHSDEEQFSLWLSSYVGAGAGDCGTGLAWQCENITEICELGPTDVLGLELGGVFGMAADTVHVLAHSSTLLDIRKDLETDQWSCATVGGTQDHQVALVYGDSISMRHEFDGRLKPQVTFRGESAGGDQGQYFRAMLDYDGLPLPAWGDEEQVALTWGSSLAFSSMARLDYGLSDVVPAPTGHGQPALVSVPQHLIMYDGDHFTCLVVGLGPGWLMEYRVAADESGSTWSNPELMIGGQPCTPSMDAGWDGDPYVAYVDQSVGNVMVTTRRPGPGWQVAETAGLGGIEPSLAVDYDDGSITIAYRELASNDLVVVDGAWVD